MADKHPESERARWAVIYEAMVGATAPGTHHEDVPGVQEKSLEAGHEPDRFDAKGIIMVPVLVVVTTFLTYIIITGTFALLSPGKRVESSGTSPLAKASADEPYNERVVRINSSNPKADVYQPRLEGMKKLELKRVTADTPDPEYLRSFKPAASKENSPEYYPQDLYPHRYVDLLSGKKVLLETEWLNKDKGIARIPVEEAMTAVLNKLPVKSTETINGSTIDLPKLSNGGQADAPAPVSSVKSEQPKTVDKK